MKRASSLLSNKECSKEVKRFMDKNDTNKNYNQIEVWNLVSSICDACLSGDYQNCYCDSTTGDVTTTKVHLTQKELSNDSLDDCGFSSSHSLCNQRDHLDSSGSFTNSISGEYISDNEFDVGFVDDNHRTLPPSVTDWDTIDSVLSDELLPEQHDTSIASRVSEGPVMQMVFLDCESDKDSVPDVEVYYDDAQDAFNGRSTSSYGSERNVESRDSGYVTGDIYDVNIEHVTDTKTRRTSLDTAEEASRLLAALRLHEEMEEKRKRDLLLQREEEENYRKQLYHKSVEELRMLKEALELQVAEVNIELLNKLSLRDDLHSLHQALLVNADDIAKSNDAGKQDNNINDENNGDTTPTKKAKRRSFWFR